MKNGKIFIISGPSGVGKNTIVKGLLETPDLNLAIIKSYTTRLKRPSDDIDQNYMFISVSQFKELEEKGEILESNFFNNNYYGSSKKEIRNKLDSGVNIIKDIDVNGGFFYKNNFSNATLIFVYSSLEKIRRRLEERKQNSVEEINDRLKTAEAELKQIPHYDFSVENVEGKPEIAIEKIAQIIRARSSEDI